MSRDNAFPNNHSFNWALQNITLNLERIETRTCSDVKAMSLGTAAIPFSLTSGNILKRAISMAYMLDMAPPKVHSNTVTFSRHYQDHSTCKSHSYFHWPRVLLGHGRRPCYWLSLNWILRLRHKLRGSREGALGSITEWTFPLHTHLCHEGELQSILLLLGALWRSF